MRPLPDFPWDLLAPYKERATAHGLIDLSIGTPVDPVPALIQQALADASDAHGYPTTHGTPALRASISGWMRRRLEVDIDPSAILPTIGSKELVASLPFQLGLGPQDVVAIPAIAYPTYDVGAKLAGAHVMTADGVDELEAARVRAEAAGRRLRLVWLNSPSNPTGAVLPVDVLRDIVTWSRTHGILVANDECYIELGWDVQPVSIMHPDVVGDRHDGVLAVHSLSKRSNLAGYRAAFVTGDPQVIRALLELRKHSGLMLPGPVQSAMAAACDDDDHVVEQRSRYAQRRSALRSALTAAGFTVTHSEAGLYLWATRNEDCWDTVGWLADRGILVAPGAFYGQAGGQHIRMAMTGTDSNVTSAVDRLR